MRSWSIPVGRLFGVDVRIHLTFFILPTFIYWTDYAVRQGNATGPRDMAIVGIILACVAAHECGHMLAAPPSRPHPQGSDPVAADWRRAVRRIAYREAPIPRSALAAGSPPGPDRAAGKPGPRRSRRRGCDRCRARRRSLDVALPPGPQPAEKPGVGESLSRNSESHARLSSRRRAHPARVLVPHARPFRPPRGALSPSATPSPWSL